MSVLWVSDRELDKLTPLSEALVLAMGALGQPAARGHLAHTVARSGLLPEAGAWERDPAALTPVLAKLREAGLAREPNKGFWTLTPAVLETACRRAHRQGRLRALAAAGQTSFDTGKVLLDPVGRDLAALRLAFFEDRSADWQAAQEKLRQAHRSALGFRDPLALICGRPFDPAWFESLSPAQQTFAAWALLHDQVVHHQRLEPFRVWLEARRSRPHPLGPMLEYLILEGHAPEARKVLERLKPAQRQLTPIALLESALLLTEGQAREAAEGFEKLLAGLGQGPRRKAVHLPGLMDLFACLAFIGREDEQGQALAAERLELLGRRLPGDPIGLLAGPLQRLVQHRAGLPVREEPAARTATEGLAPFVDVLCGYLCSARPAAGALDAAEAALAGLPLGLFRRELEELRRRSRGQLATGHFPFTDLVRHSETWEKALADLQGLVKAPANQRPGRLAWWVWRDPDAKGPYALEAREQRLDARGHWTRGKAISMKRLKEESRGYDFLLPQDQAVISCIREGWKGFEMNLDGALQALVGHPLVFWSEGELEQATRVEVVAGQPELRVTRKGQALELRLEPALEEGDVLAVPDGLFRVRILTVTPAHRKLAGIVGQGLAVPLAAEAQVLEALRAVAPMVTIQSDVAVAAEAARKAGLETVPGDPSLQLLLMPFHQGLKAQLRVEPLAGAGYNLPGQGGANLLVEQGGATRVVARDLAAEGARAEALLAALPTLPLEEGRTDWMLDDPESCMSLLLDLESAKDLVQVRWPEGGRLAAPRTLGLEAMSLRVKQRGAWFSAEGEAKLDEHAVVGLQQLLEATEKPGTRFVTLGDGRVYALAETFRRRLDDLRALGETKDGALRLPSLGVLALEGLAAEVGEFQADRGWAALIEKLRTAMALDPQVPSGFQASMRPYQLEGFRWLLRLAGAGLGACLADDMGLGKTVQTLAMLLARSGDGPSLVVAPTSVCSNWEAEAAKFAPSLRVRRFGEGDREAALREAGPGDLFICTYGLLAMEAHRLQKTGWGTVVLDEGQSIKNAFTKRSQAVMELKAGFRVLLSGTPVENHLAELWNLFHFLNPGLLGTLEQFRKRFQDPIERDQDEAASSRLRRLVAPFLLRRTKAEVLKELPERTEIVLELEPTPEEAAFQEALRRQSLDALEGGPGQALQVLAALMRLRRACCNPRLVQPDLDVPSSKLEAFLDLVGELRENGHRALVFSQFVDHLALLREALDARGVSYQYLDGSIPARRRAALVQALQVLAALMRLRRAFLAQAFPAGEMELPLISLKAGGTGLNLTAADYVIHMDPWWNPAVEDQASDRAHRIGQTRPVTVYRLVLKGSVEQKILALHEHKRQLADDILAGAGAAAKLDAAALLALLQEG